MECHTLIVTVEILQVYINLDQPGDHVCSYCGRGFTLDDYDHHHHHDDDEEDH